MEFGAVEVLVAVGVLLLALYYCTLNLDFWKKYNVPGPKPIPIFGNFKDVVLGKINHVLLMKRYYDEYKSEPYVGIFVRSIPLLILRDPELIKHVLIKDFSTFPERGLPPGDSDDPFFQNLFTLEHERWRPLRYKLSPAFTSGKLRDMVYLIVDCANRFENYVEAMAKKGEPLECRELLAKYATDVIGICVFGLNMNSIDDENSEFRNAGRELTSTSPKSVTRRLFREWFPMLFKLLKPFIKNEHVGFLVKSTKETMEYRKKNNFRRNDFIDLLMDLKNQPDQFSTFELTDTLVVAQAFIFFLAGFETSSSAMSHTMYELALNPDIQDKLRAEIKEVLNEDGKLTYDNIKHMKYLDKVFKETLRKYPPSGVLQRKSVAPYTFAGTKLRIPADTRIIIPVWAIQHDPDIFPNPELFDPERFTEENEQARHPMNYLPFGDGPHNCIALRFAQYQVKIGIIALVNKFKVDVCDKTCNPYKLHPRSIIPAPVGGIYLKFTTL